MRDEWDSWARLDAKVFGVTCDSPFVVDKFRQELEIPFPILSDFNREAAKTWGAIHDELLGLRDVPKRSVFVIDAGGTVTYDWVSDDPGQLPDFAAVKAAVEAVKVGS
jgi:peroxiredoxin